MMRGLCRRTARRAPPRPWKRQENPSSCVGWHGLSRCAACPDQHRRL